MEKIRIITDSASDFEDNDYASVTVLPMTIHIDNTDYLDSVTLSRHRFYELLTESDALPTTSLISPAVFSDAFNTAVSNGEKVIAIVLSGKLSGTYQSAVLAAEDFPENVTVIDSMNASVGEQTLVRYALQLLQKGQTYDQICQKLFAIRSKIHILALLDTLEYLKKGGRISSAVALVGGVLHLKPVLTIRNGAVEMLGTARGSKKGNNYLMEEIRKTAGIDFSKSICLGYTGLDDSLLKKYIQDSRQLWDGHESCLHTSIVGSTIGTHVGPGAVLVGFIEQF